MSDKAQMERMVAVFADAKRMGPNVDGNVETSLDRSRTAGMSNPDWNADAKEALANAQGNFDRARSEGGKAKAAAAVAAAKPAAAAKGTPTRHLGNRADADRAGQTGEKFKSTWNTAEPKSRDARASIGILGEKMDARGERPNTIQVSDPNKPYNEHGPDRLDLCLTEDGRFAIDARDNKAIQADGTIADVTALTDNLEVGLRNGMASAKSISESPQANDTVRELYGVVERTIREILGPDDAAPSEVKANIDAAKADGRLTCTVVNHAGNKSGLSAKLKALGLRFEETRKTITNAAGETTPIKQAELIREKPDEKSAAHGDERPNAAAAPERPTAASLAQDSRAGAQPPPALTKTHDPDAPKPTPTLLERPQQPSAAPATPAKGFNPDAAMPSAATLERPSMAPTLGGNALARGLPPAASPILPDAPQDHGGAAGSAGA